MRVSASRTLAAPMDQIWSIVTEPEATLMFMSGVTRWEVVSDEPTGLGARYRMLFRVGSAEVGGLIEIVEWLPPTEMAWTSITGLDQRGRWRLREAPGGRTRVELRLAYGVAGSGLFGWLAERVAAPTVGNHLRQSLVQLERMVEHERLRERAAGRARLARRLRGLAPLGIRGASRTTRGRPGLGEAGCRAGRAARGPFGPLRRASVLGSETSCWRGRPGVG